jgi:2-oxo-4-hydroxy-4-carboxy-5-ureidoimidazoline decarboxylase
MHQLAIGEDELLACCASPVWAAAVAGSYPDADALHRAADAALALLDWSEIEKALAAHPRIGERAGGQGREAAWSRQEQAAATTDPAALAAANAEYERVFGRVFLVNATGRTSGEILADLRTRLANDEETERVVVREQLRGIVAVRLEKWLS